MKEYKLSELVLDWNIYPRREVDSQHAALMAEAIEGGASLPPLVIEKSSKRIVDGWHRHKAYKRLSKGDPNFVVECIEKTYKTEADLFLDAIRYNAQHGRALTNFDRTHCVLVCQSLRVADKDVANVLHIEVAKVQQLIVDRTATGTNGKQKLVPIKRTIQHMAGKKMNKAQVECNDKLGGQQQGFYAQQLILLIESELLDVENEKLMELLAKLAGLLESVLAVKA